VGRRRRAAARTPPRIARGQRRRLRLWAGVEGPAAGRRDRATVRRAAPHAHARDRRRQATPAAVADDTARRRRTPPLAPRAASVRRRGARPAVGGRLSYLRCWDGRAWFLSRSRSRPTARASSAGSWPRTCAPPWCSMRCRWRSPNAAPAPTSRSCTTASAARNAPVSTPSRRWPTTASLASVGSVGDTYRNALAESFKTELISDRVWRTRFAARARRRRVTPARFNHTRLYQALGDIPSPRRWPSTLPGPRPRCLSKSKEKVFFPGQVLADADDVADRGPGLL
jgi:hypothetical protein